MRRTTVAEEKSILVIDDDKDMLTALYQALTRSGHSVATACNGQAGIDMLENEAISMVITDIKMPGMGGLEVLREIRRRENNLPVMMITAYGTIEDAVVAIKEGAFDYLLKPFSIDVLEDMVFKALAGADRREETDGGLEEEGGCAPEREIIGDSPKMKQVMDIARRAAGADATVLIQGESGTGKELVARYICARSKRRDKPFVAVNCAALPDGLLESELFGHEKGAFTGALSRKPGKFEQAHGGTILLDEIGEMKPELQAKLLRVLQERQMDRVGGSKPVKVDIRVIATTNRDLRAAISEGGFREDLYYRLHVIPLTIPPLRERKEDVPGLVDFFLLRKCTEQGRGEYTVSPEAMEKLVQYPWPGNIRELENVIERATIFEEPGELTPQCFPLEGGIKNCGRNPGIRAGQPVKELEKDLIMETLRQTNGNRTQAAKLLGMSLRTLRNRLRDYREAGNSDDGQLI